MVLFKSRFFSTLLISVVLSVCSSLANAAPSLIGTIDMSNRPASHGWGAQGFSIQYKTWNGGWSNHRKDFTFQASTMNIFSDGTASMSANMTDTATNKTWGLNISFSNPQFRKFNNPNTDYLGTNNGTGANATNAAINTNNIMSVLNGNNSFNTANNGFGGTGHYFLAWNTLSLDLDDNGNQNNNLPWYQRIKTDGWEGMFANGHVAALDYGHNGLTTDLWTKNAFNGYGGYTGDHKGYGTLRPTSTGVPIPTTAALLGLGLLALGRKKLQIVK